MKRKLFASVLCIAMGVILLAGCGKQQHRECKSRGDNGNAFCSKKLKPALWTS